MHDSLIFKSVITSPFIKMDIRHAIEITGYNSVNIAKHETPQVPEECLAFGMFIWGIHIDNLKSLLMEFELRR